MLTARQLEIVDKTFTKKVFSALFFAVSSIMITLVNKTIISVYYFPSYHFLGLCQMATIIMMLGIGRRIQLVQFPPLQRGVVLRIWPLPLVFLGNLLTGLGSTKDLSFPMFTALRRFSLLMTMIFEKIVLGVQASLSAQGSVIAIIGGAVIAAADDVTFSLTGYTCVLLNDAFSAANGVYLKKVLDSKQLNAGGLLYYDSFFKFIPAFCVACCTNDLYMLTSFEYWNDPLFVGYFVISCLMGIVFSYSVMLCTQFNGALTTSIMGCMKNVIFTYVGVAISYEHLFSWPKFVGMNISVLGCSVYILVIFKNKLLLPTRWSTTPM